MAVMLSVGGGIKTGFLCVLELHDGTAITISDIGVVTFCWMCHTILWLRK